MQAQENTHTLVKSTVMQKFYKAVGVLCFLSIQLWAASQVKLENSASRTGAAELIQAEQQLCASHHLCCKS